MDDPSGFFSRLLGSDRDTEMSLEVTDGLWDLVPIIIDTDLACKNSGTSSLT